MKTRFAEIDELPSVLVMYMAALDEIKDHILQPDIERCADEVITSWAKAPCVILEDKGEIIGFAGLKTLIAPYTNVPQISEYMFYIKKQFRSMKAAKTLSNGVKAVADKFKMPLFMLHMLNDSTIKDKDKFLRRWGYTPFALSVTYGVRT